MSNYPSDREECKGCRMNSNIMACYFISSNIVELCPCGNCLVKPMCTEFCDERDVIKHNGLVRRIKEFKRDML